MYDISLLTQQLVVPVMKDTSLN